jgi:hypothetical protein
MGLNAAGTKVQDILGIVHRLDANIDQSRSLWPRYVGAHATIVRDPGTATVDGKIIVKATEMAMMKARRMNAEGSSFNMDELLMRYVMFDYVLSPRRLHHQRQ